MGEDRKLKEQKLYEEIERMKVDLDFIKKPFCSAKALVEAGYGELSIRQQCRLLSLCRSSKGRRSMVFLVKVTNMRAFSSSSFR